MHIRSFQQHDVEGVKSLIGSIMGEEYVTEQKAYQYGDLEDIKKAYGGIREKFLIAEEDGNIIGTAAIKEDSPTTAILRRLFVHPSHRSRGIGSMLVDTVLDFCKLNHYKWVEFKATSSMKEALGLLTDKKAFAEKSRHQFENIEIVVLHYKIH